MNFPSYLHLPNNRLIPPASFNPPPPVKPLTCNIVTVHTCPTLNIYTSQIPFIYKPFRFDNHPQITSSSALYDGSISPPFIPHSKLQASDNHNKKSSTLTGGLYSTHMKCRRQRKKIINIKIQPFQDNNTPRLHIPSSAPRLCGFPESQGWSEIVVCRKHVTKSSPFFSTRNSQFPKTHNSTVAPRSTKKCGHNHNLYYFRSALSRAELVFIRLILCVSVVLYLMRREWQRFLRGISMWNRDE